MPYSKTSIRIVLSELTALLNYAVEENKIIPANPALKLGKKLKNVRNSREAINPLTAEEVERFVAAVLDRSWSRPYSTASVRHNLQVPRGNLRVPPKMNF